MEGDLTVTIEPVPATDSVVSAGKSGREKGTKMSENMTRTLERVMDDNPRGIFPVRTFHGRAGDHHGAIYRTVWHQFIEVPHSEAEFTLSACGKADFSTAELPKKFRYDYEPMLCEECLRSPRGEYAEGTFLAQARAMVAEIKEARSA